jgi:hypothetical protein
VAASVVQPFPRTITRNAPATRWTRTALDRHADFRKSGRAGEGCSSRLEAYRRWDAAGLWVIPNRKD